MALNIATEEFYRLAGHDGSGIAFHWLDDPQRRIGFHIQEAVNVARKLNYSATPFELFPQTAATLPEPRGLQSNSLIVRYECGKDLSHNWYLFKELIRKSQGVIECQSSKGYHAVAFDRDSILDPDGRVFPYSREACEQLGLFTRCLWQVTKC